MSLLLILFGASLTRLDTWNDSTCIVYEYYINIYVRVCVYNISIQLDDRKYHVHVQVEIDLRSITPYRRMPRKQSDFYVKHSINEFSCINNLYNKNQFIWIRRRKENWNKDNTVTYCIITADDNNNKDNQIAYIHTFAIIILRIQLRSPMNLYKCICCALACLRVLCACI